MASVAACKRVGQIGPNSWTIRGVSRFKGVVSPLDASTFPPSAIRLLLSPSPFSQWRQVSQQLVKSNGKRLFLINTLALVRRLEAEGLPSKQTEAITAAITNCLFPLFPSLEMQKGVVDSSDFKGFSGLLYAAFHLFHLHLLATVTSLSFGLSRFHIPSSLQHNSLVLSQFWTLNAIKFALLD
ncbi:hypothetical protein J1N35_033770 [Gossypium stocksii]|uniref:Uncharacterized protein n=1 Tax=Gossypium stocksii TaxID=47602 RepID=A0A9D3ZPX7_9ROSI|nr:hypothetical protein J1N35_033770 [Gossypium stocksii]